MSDAVRLAKALLDVMAPCQCAFHRAMTKKDDSKYVSKEGHFKGKAGSGERFKNCMRSGKSRALCAAIGRKAGKIP